MLRLRCGGDDFARAGGPIFCSFKISNIQMRWACQRAKKDGRGAATRCGGTFLPWCMYCAQLDEVELEMAALWPGSMVWLVLHKGLLVSSFSTLCGSVHTTLVRSSPFSSVCVGAARLLTLTHSNRLTGLCVRAGQGRAEERI